MRVAFKWIEQFEIRHCSSFNKALLQSRDMRRNGTRSQLLRIKHPAHGIEAVQPRSIKCAPQKPAAILRIADSTGRKGKVFKRGIPARHHRPWREARRRVKEHP